LKQQTEGVTESIISAARKEFLESGYLNASLRKISADCNVSTHTIYTRFKDKEGLLDAVVSEAAEGLRQIYESAVDEVKPEDSVSEAEKKSDDGTEKFLTFVYEHFEDFKIIICKAAGTKYEDYMNQLIKKEEENYKRILGQIGKNKKVSDFFYHFRASTGFSTIAEVVAHDLTLQEARDFMKLQEIYNYGGLEALIKMQK